MARIIKGERIVDDNWTVLRLAEGESAESVTLPAGEVFIPLAVWNARRAEIVGRGGAVGVWLASNEGAEAIESRDDISIIALDFPKFADGRAYTTARLLRERFGFKGEIRAIGDVLQDQLFYMKRCGFDAYAVRADKNIESALRSLNDFPEVYQTAVDQPQPLFRRRAA